MKCRRGGRAPAPCFVIRPSRLARVIVSSVPSHIEYWEHRVERIEWATSNRAVKGPSLSFTVFGFTEDPYSITHTEVHTSAFTISQQMAIRIFANQTVASYDLYG